MAIIKRERAGGVRYEVRVFNKAASRQVYVGTFTRRKDAVDAEAEAKRRLILGERPVREEIVFSDLARKWLASRSGVRQSTRDDYRVCLRHALPRLGGLLVSDIGRRDVDELIADLTSKYAPNTVRKTIVVLKMVLRSAVDWEYIDRIPVGESRLSLPKVSRRQFRPLEPEQVRRLIDAAPEYWRPWFVTAVTTGLRRGELFGLTWSDVDLRRGELFVRHQLMGNSLVEPKSDAAHRRIPLPSVTVASLESHKASCPRMELDLVFPMPSSAVVCPGNWQRRVFVPARIAAGLPALRIHDLRHVYASALIRQGRSIKYVQTVLGHSDASVTLNVYGWLYPDEGVFAAHDMDRWLQS